MYIGKNTRISHHANLDRGINPKGMCIGDNIDIKGSVTILTHDACRNLKRNLKADVRIDTNCFIDMRTIILSGISIENEVIVGVASIE